MFSSDIRTKSLENQVFEGGDRCAGDAIRNLVSPEEYELTLFINS